jgi:hypothetical protein
MSKLSFLSNFVWGAAICSRGEGLSGSSGPRQSAVILRKPRIDPCSIDGFLCCALTNWVRAHHECGLPDSQPRSDDRG